MISVVPRFFVPAEAVFGDRCRITGTDAAHLARSLRVRRGERLLVVAGGVTEHGVEVTEVNPDAVEGIVRWSRPAGGEPLLRVEVLQAIPRAGMDEAVENLAEVGAAAIRPIYTERTVVRPDPAHQRHRTERWRSIAASAAGLAFRAAPPPVHEPSSLATALAALPPGTRLIACAFEVACQPLAGLAPAPQPTLALAVGPEGGWGAHDLSLLTAAGAEFVHLGPRVLRVRLAGTAALSVLLAAAGEWASPYDLPLDANPSRLQPPA
ncbi:MAG: 16S rRNA (uracil(1498)-N(3))-methyltransferase [Candidatus Dormibacteria bacterium]